ncbi:MAG: ATP-binding protein [Flammeovirgaceae bacterium]|nr:ATP-binding protein [Flammeovirgaceae bacterium]
MTHKIRVSCSKSNLKTIRDFVNSVLGEHEIPEKEMNLIIVAIDEVCSNLIIHSHSRNSADELELKITSESEILIFEIIDKGEIFNITDYTVPTMDKVIKNKKNGGIGLILVKMIMDRIQIEKSEGLNVCRLYKSLAR